MTYHNEQELVRLTLALGAGEVGGPLSAREQQLIREAESLRPSPGEAVTQTRADILAGVDRLGELFIESRDSVERRADGAVYTPSLLVDPMVEWVIEQQPNRVVDPGSGSGRFVLEVAKRLPNVEAVAIDLDPLATLMTRANLAVHGIRNTRVLNADYTKVRLPKIAGRTAFVGNPPYVRHHDIQPTAKAQAKLAAVALGHQISGLAGLHAYFFLYTALLSRPGDVGCFVTSSEWLDVNYGAIVRSLLLDDLGAESMHIVEPTALPFEGTQTTAVITTFKVGEQPDPVRLQDVTSLPDLSPLAQTGRPVHRARLQETRRWSGLLRAPQQIPEGLIELGELCRVHRGTVTGANSTWVRRHGVDLPQSVLYPSVTRARELFLAGGTLSSTDALKLVVDIPSDLDALDPSERRRVQRFIAEAKKAGIDKGYVAAHRRAWWSVGLKEPAPILATYMARRPPAFVVNQAEARHINIAHGLYPREPLDADVIDRLAKYLREQTTLASGRVYAGGLTKFEPREMERLLVPELAILSTREHSPTRMVTR